MQLRRARSRAPPRRRPRPSPRRRSPTTTSRLSVSRTEAHPAYARALRLLAARPRSRARLRERLLAAGHSPEEVEAALARAVELGYLDDCAFARARAEALLGRYAAPAVERKLAADGVSAELARETLAELQADDASLARTLLERRFGSEPLAGTLAARAARFLAGRGFGEELIERLLRRTTDG
ncbi:MAG: regulatory protein RecX [Myxococcales bacterium]